MLLENDRDPTPPNTIDDKNFHMPNIDDLSPLSGAPQKAIGSMRRFFPETETGQFLARTVGASLTRGLAELLIARPEDPVKFLADFMLEYDRLSKTSGSQY